MDAVKLAKQTSTTKRFDATVEVAMRLGVDPRKADQMVRGTVSLPHGTGKTARAAVFATGAKAVQDIKGGKIEYRVDRQSNLHLVIGKTSFTETQLLENYATALDEVLRSKPSAAK